MQKLLTASLSNFQAEILFWLQIAAGQIKNVELDLSTFEADSDDGEDYMVELSNIRFQKHVDDTWSSCWLVTERDNEGFEYLESGDTLTSGERNAQTLVFRTLQAMATYGLSFVFEHEGERRVNLAETYQPCRKRSLYDGAYCGCWRCRHGFGSSGHVAGCALCQSIGRTVETAERDNEIPF